MKLKRIEFYCTEELYNKIIDKFGGERGRAGKLSANIERLLWKVIDRY
jgi:hypothetical protein